MAINKNGDILRRLFSSYGCPERTVGSSLKISRYLFLDGLGATLRALADRPHIATNLRIVVQKKVGNVLILVDGASALIRHLHSPGLIVVEAHRKTIRRRCRACS